MKTLLTFTIIFLLSLSACTTTNINQSSEAERKLVKQYRMEHGKNWDSWDKKIKQKFQTKMKKLEK